MTAPPGVAPAPEPRVGPHSAERDRLSTRTKQMRYLVAELDITRQQAHRLIKAYEADLRDARSRDAREFIREEFGPWLRRRGDLLVVRSKLKHGWAVTSG